MRRLQFPRFLPILALERGECYEALYSLREKKQYTQVMLAQRLGVSDKTISKWETGVSQS